MIIFVLCMGKLSLLYNRYKFPLLLSAIIVLAIWPISFYIFVPKWDNIDCYLPYKYFWTSELIQGYWPQWNPFQYFGYPVYSDMQNGMWSPVTWLMVALFGEYTTIGLSTELTIYFLITGLGMYRFSRVITSSLLVRMFCGLSLALSGFMIGTAQIMIFLMGIAWLPWILDALIKLKNTFHLKYVLALGLFISLEATSASPAYSIILIYILFGAIFYSVFKTTERKLRMFALFALAGLVSVVLSLPMIHGFLDFQPYFGRLGKLPYEPWIYDGSFDFWEYVSFISPMSTLSQSDIWGATDLTLRNGYIGIFGFGLFLFGLVQFKFDRKVRMLSVLSLLFLILAAGDYTPFYKWFYHLPGFGTFRHPSFFRSHLTLFLVLIAGVGFNFILTNKQRVKPMLLVLILIVILGILIGLQNTSFEEVGLLFNQMIHFTEKPQFSTAAFTVLNGLITLVLLVFFMVLLRFKRAKLVIMLVFFVGIDLIIHSQLMAPTTLINTKHNQESFKSFFERIPSNYNQQSLGVELKNLKGYIPELKPYPVWRNVGTFTKSISYKGHNATQFKLFNDMEKNGGFKNVIQNPLFFVGKTKVDSAGLAIGVNTIWGEGFIINDSIEFIGGKIDHNYFEAKVANTSNKEGVLVLNQNYHHCWQAKVGCKNTEIELINDGLMGVKIPANYAGIVQYTFENNGIKVSFCISLLGYLLVGLGLLYWRKA